jgi:hypothetical protein
MESKKCTKCNKVKEISCFYFKKTRNVYENACKQCILLQNKKWRDNNKEKYLSQKKEYREKNKDEIIQRKKKYYKNNKDKILKKSSRYYKDNIEKRRRYIQNNRYDINKRRRKYYKNNTEKVLLINNKWRQENKDKINYYYRRKIKEDLNYKLRHYASVSVGAALRKVNKNKNGSVIKYLPYSIEDLKNHLESLFEPWMSWNNWGVYKKETWNDNDSSTWTWQIDHIIPQSMLLYDSMNHPNFKKCWSLSNLRPLSSKENILKSNQ